MDDSHAPQEPAIEARFDEANGCLAVGDLDAAITGYRACVAADSTYFDGWHALGMALMKTGELKEAIGAAMMATELRPNDQLAWTSLSQMFMKDGRIAAAEDAKSKATIIGLGGKVAR